MRFNQRELAFIALQPPETFDIQGLLWLKEKDGYFWQRSESYTERWCRLTGNLLFYCKANEKTSELAGLIVLERCSINKNLSSTRKYAFTIVFDEQDETQQYNFAANSETELHQWTKQIENASYDKLKEKLHSLRGQLMEMTGEDPLPANHHLVQDQPKVGAIGNSPSTSLAMNSDEAPLLEISIECNDLKTTTENRVPNAFIIVSTMTPPGTTWIRLTQTEIIEQASDPYFLTAVVIPSGGNYSEVTRLKFVVFDVRDRDKEEMTHLGQAVCTIRDVLTSTNQKIQLSLTGLDSPTPSGTITLIGWKLEMWQKPFLLFVFTLSENNYILPPSWDFKVGSPPRQHSGSMSVRDNDEDTHTLRSRCGSVNKPKFDNLLQRSYRFPTIMGTSLKVVEMMGESFLTFRIPQQLLKIFITEEKQKILDLNKLGDLNEEWNDVRKEILDNHFKLVNNYTTIHRHLYQERERQDKGVSTGVNFKSSRLKTDKRLAFATTNLHLQRLKVVDGSNEHVYDIVTFGAPSAHSMKYSKGGLRKLMANLREAYYSQSNGANRASRAKKTRVELEKLNIHLADLCEKFRKCLTNKSMDNIVELLPKLKSQTDQLLKHCDVTFIIDSLLVLNSSRPSNQPHLNPFDNDFQEDDVSTLPASTSTDGPECQTLRHTIESSLDQISSVVSQLCQAGQNINQAPKTSTFLRETLNDFSRGVETLIKEFNLGMVFVLLQEESHHAQVMQVLRQRRDISLSQALCALICGFEAKVYTSLTDAKFMKQLCEIGILAEFECLLSTHGDEMGMLEDMSVATHDLSSVKFKFASSHTETIPCVTGTRTNIEVTIFLDTESFSHLTKDLQEGKLVRVTPVLFTQGINEQATLAERFGDTSLQEAINVENFDYLNFYYLNFRDKFPEEADVVTPREPPLDGLIEHLKTNVYVKKNKNVEILFLAQEVCWRMNGIRFTSCKSAKDRTSMAVTLEQCSILKRKHNLQPERFFHALGAMRSGGTRRENCFKNAGIRRYAFNYWQVMALPRLYRPPDGTYGKNIQA